MAVGDTDVGAGCTITWETGYCARIETIEWGGISRGYVETTNMATTGGDEFLPYDTYDPGTLTVTLQFNETSTGNPPITEAAENCTLTFPGAKNYQCSAFLTNWSLSTATKEKSMVTAELKFSGDITFAA